MCVVTETWVVMEGSSDSNWQKTDSSRGGLNSSSFFNRINRIFRERNENTSNDSGLASVRKTRERTLLQDFNNYRSQAGGGTTGTAAECGDVSLRQWLDNPERTVDALECVHVFSQIVDIVNLAHTQGIVVHNVRPSCFVMSSYNRVSFIESASCSDSGSDSIECGSNGETAEFKGSELGTLVNAASRIRSETGEAGGNERNGGDRKQSFPMKQILHMESNWYTSPEEASGGSSSCASDIYQLGVLLFEVSDSGAYW